MQGLKKTILVLRPAQLGGELNPEYPILRYPATVGRHPTNDIELPCDAVSRYHARITRENNAYRVTDLHSSNGTFINGQKVQNGSLADQDTVSFGTLDFIVSVEDDEDSYASPNDVSSETSVQFIQQDDNVQTVFHTEVIEDTSREKFFKEDITDQAQLKTAKKHLVCLYRLHEVFNNANDEEHMLRSALKVLFDVLPVDRGVILTRDDQDATVYRPAAIFTKRTQMGSKIGISKTILQRSLKEKVAILTRDAREDERFKASESIQLSRMRSVMCAPLISQQRVLGFIHLDTTSAVRSFTEDDLAFLANAGVEVALQLHNMRMLDERIRQERMAAIGQTITGMAHNVKNILVLSQGGIEMMGKRLQTKNYDALEETWQVVQRGIGRINKLVQDMLDYSRARTIEKRRVDVNSLVRELVQTIDDELSSREIDIHLDLDENLTEMMLDADALDKAICNLLINACEACDHEEGMIWLRTKLGKDGDLRIEIEDNAGGIPQEVMPRIFIPFFTTKGSKGSGLGLAMTKKFIEDMGGSLEVRTEEGKGTCFTITLLVAPTRQASVPKPDATRDS